MDIEKLKQILEKRFTKCEFIVEGDGKHFNVIAISDEFKSLNRLKSQQYIFAGLKQEFANGDIHALDLKTFDRDTWENGK